MKKNKILRSSETLDKFDLAGSEGVGHESQQQSSASLPRNKLVKERFEFYRVASEFSPSAANDSCRSRQGCPQSQLKRVGAKTRVEVSPFAVQGLASPQKVSRQDQKLEHQVEVLKRSETRMDRHGAQISEHCAFLDLLRAEVEEHVFTPSLGPERQYRDRLSADRDVRFRGDSCRFHRRVVVCGVNLLSIPRPAPSHNGWHGRTKAPEPRVIRWLEPTAQPRVSVQQVCQLSAVFENRLEHAIGQRPLLPPPLHESEWCPP